MIPKILHYIWLGGEKPQSIQNYISTFPKHFSGYKIIEWNESNIDISNYDPELKDLWETSYRNKKFAFCSDISRMYILLENGGIYVDTDEEFLKPIPDEFLKKPFLCRNNPTQEVCNGCVWGCCKGDTLASACIRWFSKHLQENKSTYGKGWIFNKILNSYFVSFGYDQENTETQDVVDYRIYATEYFCPMRLMTKRLYLTDNSIANHHYEKSWIRVYKK